jgi:hypothetical protein
MSGASARYLTLVVHNYQSINTAVPGYIHEQLSARPSPNCPVSNSQKVLSVPICRPRAPPRSNKNKRISSFNSHHYSCPEPITSHPRGQCANQRLVSLSLLTLSPAQDSANVNPCSSNRNSSRGHAETHKPGRSGKERRQTAFGSSWTRRVYGVAGFVDAHSGGAGVLT